MAATVTNIIGQRLNLGYANPDAAPAAKAKSSDPIDRENLIRLAIERVRDNTALHLVDSFFGHTRDFVVTNLNHLVQEVDDLLAPANEIASQQVC